MPQFLHKKCNIKNYQKITKKLISCWWLAFFGSRPLPQTDPSQVPFLTVFAMFYAHRALLKNEPVFCLGGGSAAPARLPIAKAKATPHAMRSNMPGIRCLVHRRIRVGWLGCRPGLIAINFRPSIPKTYNIWLTLGLRVLCLVDQITWPLSLLVICGDYWLLFTNEVMTHGGTRVASLVVPCVNGFDHGSVVHFQPWK